MSSTRVIFTYKRKRLSSCSGVGHTDVCPEFSLDVQGGKDQPGLNEGSESTVENFMVKESADCPSAQLHDSSEVAEKYLVQLSDTCKSGEMQLGSDESSEDKKHKTSGEYVSTEASSQDATNAISNNSCLDLDSSCLLTDQDIQGGAISNSMEEPDPPSKQRCMSNIHIAKSKVTAPLLTFSRRLKRKTDLGGIVVLEEPPANNGPAVSEEKKVTCKLSCSCDVPSNRTQLIENSVNSKLASNDAVTMDLSSPSREKITDKESREPYPRTDVDISVHTEGKSCVQDERVLDTSPAITQSLVQTSKPITSAVSCPDALETTSLQKDIAPLSCDNACQNVELCASQQAQTSSGGSQLTSSGSSDVKTFTGKTIQETVSSSPMDHSCPPSGTFVIDCNVIPESDLQEIDSDYVQHSSATVENSEKVTEEVHLKSKGLELFKDTDLMVSESPSRNVARLHSDGLGPLAAEKKPNAKCLQLFSEEGQSSLSAPTSKISKTEFCRAQQNGVFALDGKDKLRQAPDKASTTLGLSSLPMEPIFEGQTSQHGSGVHLLQDHNVGFREFIQNPGLHSFPDHSFMLRDNVLLENCNTRATALRGNRNISLDRFEPRSTMWSEEELDSLWIGIRRHGRGNWHAMLLDPRLRFAPWRVARDLADQWEREQYRLLSGYLNTSGKCAKPPDMHNLDSHSHFMYSKAGAGRNRVSTETQLSLGDVYARKGRSNSRSKVKRHPNMHVTLASTLGNYNCSSYDTVQTSVLLGDGTPGMGPATNNGISHWLRESSGSMSRLFEPSPPQMSARMQTGGLHPVHPFSEPSGTSSGQRNRYIFKVPGPVGESGGSEMKQGTPDKLIVIDIDASSEETLSDDHNGRN